MKEKTPGPPGFESHSWLGNGLAVLLGIVLTVLLLCIAQCTLGNPRNESAKTTTEYSASFYRKDPVYGWAIHSNLDLMVEKKREDTLIYKARYRTDRFARRVVRSKRRSSGEISLIFLGGSNMFGEGLDDHQTLDHQLTSRFRDVESYNYAVPGYGLGHVMAQSESIDFASQTRRGRALVIYLFPGFHVDRLVGGMKTVGWATRLPRYVETDDRIVRRGFIPIRLKRLYYRSFLRSRFGLAFPFQFTNSDVEFACRVLKAVEENLAARRGESEFLLVLHPRGFDERILSCLDEHGIAWLDLHAAFDGHLPDEVGIPGDGHTNEAGNKLLADGLEERLRASILTR